MTILTIDDLTKAITILLDVDQGEAKAYAIIIMDFFGFEDRIIDNILTPGDRQLFYRFEEYGILTSEREEITLHNGNGWRTHYWRLEKDTIFRCLQGEKTIKQSLSLKGQQNVSHYEDIYFNGTQDMWAARKTPYV